MKKRHEEILRIISEEEIMTQEELAARLRERGFDAAQATISRDIKTLSLVKMTAPDGKLIYRSLLKDDTEMPEKLIPVFRHAFVSCDHAGNLIVIKTLSGMANALASAVDSMPYQGILGSVAGDDAVLIVCKTENLAAEISAVLSRLAEKKN